MIILLMIMFYLNINEGLSQEISVKKYLISEITISGNFKTKEQTILRELSFSVGDSIDLNSLKTEIQNSKENLLNKPLFNYVDLSFLHEDVNLLSVNIKVEERWYLWPEAAIYYIDRNFSNWLKERDWSRTDIGLGVIKYNFRGRNEKLTLYTFFGYDEEILLKYENVFLDKKRKHSVSITSNLKRRKETTFGIIDDKIVQIQHDDSYALKAVRASLSYAYRKEIFNSHELSLFFESRFVSDSVLNLNTQYFTNKTNNAKYFKLSYNFVRDRRNYRTFPTSGHKIDILMAKNGLQIFPESNINSINIKADISLYNHFSKRFSINNNITLKKTIGKENPFFLNTALGYLSSARSYEYYAINGRDMILSKNTLNYEIISKRIFNLKFIPWDKFNKIHFTVYASAFFDAAYVKNNNEMYNQLNHLQNSWIYGTGVGLCFLTYYDKLLRIEYSINKQQYTGLYIHFEAPF